MRSFGWGCFGVTLVRPRVRGSVDGHYVLLGCVPVRALGFAWSNHVGVGVLCVRVSRPGWCVREWVLEIFPGFSLVKRSRTVLPFCGCFIGQWGGVLLLLLLCWGRGVGRVWRALRVTLVRPCVLGILVFVGKEREKKNSHCFYSFIYWTMYVCMPVRVWARSRTRKDGEFLSDDGGLGRFWFWLAEGDMYICPYTHPCVCIGLYLFIYLLG